MPSTVTLLVEREPEIFRERALARPIKAGHPDTDFVLAARLHGELHAVQQFAELLLDALGDDVFGDFGLEPTLL